MSCTQRVWELINVAMCSESKSKTHFNIEAKLAVFIGSDTY